MVLSGSILMLFLVIMLIVNWLLFLTYSLGKQNKKSQWVTGSIAGVSLILLISLISLCVEVESEYIISDKPVVEETYTIEKITKDSIVYGYDFINTYKLKFNNKSKPRIKLYEVEDSDSVKLVVNKKKWKKQWLFPRLYVTDYVTGYDVYVQSDVYNTLKVVLYDNYVLYNIMD